MTSRAIAIVLTCVGVLLAQANVRVLGTVVSVNGAEVAMKSDAGEQVRVVAKDSVRVQRVAPGEKDLTKAETIALSDLAAGDRVLVRGVRNEAGMQADSLIIMTARAIAQRHDAESKMWQQRGLIGVIDATTASGEVRISARTQGELKTVTVVITDKTSVKRYAPDSIRFSDAVASKIDEMRKGDQLRVLGDKDATGSRIIAEQVVFGTFRTVAGTVVALGADGQEVTLKDLQSGKNLTVRTKPDSQVKKLAMGPGMRPGGPDLSAMLERLPPTSVKELKPGETVIVSATSGSKPNELTAIVLLAGAEPLIAMLTARAEARRGQDPLAGGSSLDRGLDSMMGMPVQ